MKKMLIVAAMAVILLSMPVLGNDSAGIGRFQLMGTAPIVVIDTVTGELWFVETGQRGYWMRRVCYLGPDSQLRPSPYVSQLADIDESHRKLCLPQR